jgi:hypothetical protein
LYALKKLLLILFTFSVLSSNASERKKLDIQRVSEKVSIDGELNEVFWENVIPNSGFRQNTPVAGAFSKRNTEVKLAYDDNAIYVGAIMYDQKDSMTLTLSQRDDVGNADWFSIVFDPYNAGTIGFEFIVTSAGVQVDRLHEVNGIDANWNAVWRSAVQVKEDRWVAEIQIPFSALRFSESAHESWGINFGRNIRRGREQSYWNYFDPAGVNQISQLGEMQGLEDVNSPLRLALSPYLSGYIENYDGNTTYIGNGGMDVKWGINEAFTVDMTLIPDFGQVQFDNEVLNTSPFEVYFNERRQFFTEGTELFNKADLFYSRRVGGRPMDYSKADDDLDSSEIVTNNPATSQLINATKLSGRTKSGLGIGVFNAVTSVEQAEITDTITGDRRFVKTGPLTNWNVLVFDQNLKNNSTVTLSNTNVWRSGAAYDANVTSLRTNLFTKEQRLNLAGDFTMSQKYADTAVLGHNAWVRFGKSAGNFQWSSSYSESGENFDKNDMGFQTTNNLRNVSGNVEYNWYKPFWRLYRAWSGLTANLQRFRDPDAFSNFNMKWNFGGTFRNFMTAGGGIYVEPVRENDYFEPRVSGRYYEGDAVIAPDFFISSDYSKPFALDMNGSWWQFFEEARHGFSLRISPRIRFNDKWFLVYNYQQDVAWNEEGVALTSDFDVPFDPIYTDDPIFSKRDRTTITNTVDLSYIMNDLMGITFRMRHYWSKLEFNEFFRLNDDGKMVETTYTGFDVNDQSLHDNSFNAFTIDMVYRWIFAPGSELTLVWKNSIFEYDQQVNLNYFENVGGMFENPATNSISLKILYYIDYWEVHQKLFKKNRSL